MNYRELFSKTPAVKLFFLAAIPGSVGMLASALYQTIDGVLVGRILAGDAFAALNLAMPLVIINFSLADLIGVGSAVPISVRLGEKKEAEANSIFVQPLLYGMCDSLQPAVGYNWGAGKLSRVRAIEKCCFTASAVISLLAAAALTCFPEQVATLFMAGSGQEVLSMAVGALKLFAITFVTRWFSFAMQSYMLAIEKPLPASLISVSTALVFPVLLVALLWPLGLTGIWLNFAGTSLLAGVLSLGILFAVRKELFRPDLQ